MNMQCLIEIVLFDFGGVLAEEGFRNGLTAIARRNGLDEKEFFLAAREIIYRTGYATGQCSEKTYWDEMRKAAGINDADAELRNDILSRFTPRPFMLDMVRRLKASGMKVGILSDQTNWLDELDSRFNFFHLFDAVYNSYHLGKSKLEATQFTDVARALAIGPERILFVDDDEGHCTRARTAHLKAIRYAGYDAFLTEFLKACPAYRP